MLAAGDSVYVLLLGLCLWVGDKAVQELRRVREELEELRSAVQQNQLQRAARRDARLSQNEKGKIQAVLHRPPPVRAYGPRPGNAVGVALQQPRRSRSAAAVPRPG